MTQDHAGERIWPSTDEELLLKAALFEGQAALRAWNRWKSMTTSLRPRLSWRQLMPLVYRNLTGQGLREELPADFKRSYLATWANNMYRFEALEKTLELLHGLGIQTLVLKGAALAPVYYKDLAHV
jgi:hypothetical protein